MEHEKCHKLSLLITNLIADISSHSKNVDDFNHNLMVSLGMFAFNVSLHTVACNVSLHTESTTDEIFEDVKPILEFLERTKMNFVLDEDGSFHEIN
jgi:hypothetical protein